MIIDSCMLDNSLDLLFLFKNSHLFLEPSTGFEDLLQVRATEGQLAYDRRHVVYICLFGHAFHQRAYNVLSLYKDA